MKLTILEQLPPSFYQAQVQELHEMLGGPTLIHLKQGCGSPLFVSCLLHGNEHSGFLAVQQLLKEAHERGQPLDRPLILFIANPLAAKHNKRFLTEQIDFNRVWSGGDHEQARLAQEVLSYVAQHDLYCSIDLHNNSGKNPFYGCINQLDQRFLDLARFFSPHIVYFTEPHEVLSMAMARFCPSITIEAGTSGEPAGVERLKDKLSHLLSKGSIHHHFDHQRDKVYHTIARMRFSPLATIDFTYNAHSPHDFSFLSTIDDYNFKRLSAGQSLAYVNKASSFWLEGNSNEVIDHEIFDTSTGQLVLKKDIIPAMMTKDISIIKSDCFGYLMEEYPLEFE